MRVTTVRTKSAIGQIGVVALLVCFLSTFGQAHASALTACNQQTSTHVGGIRFPSDGFFGGIEAPIETKLDSQTCTGSDNGIGVSAWIGIQDTTSAALVQIGFKNHWGPQDSSQHFCRFAENVGSNGLIVQRVYYGCDIQMANDYVYYRIIKVLSGGVYKFSVQDCAKNNPTYSNCTREIDLQSPFSGDLADALAENNQGGCQEQLMGSTADPENIGNSTHTIMVQPDVNGTFQTNAFTLLKPDGTYKPDGTTCNTHYHDDAPATGVVTTDDDRN